MFKSIFALLFISMQCYAFQISPMTTDIRAFGHLAQQKYQLINTFDYPIKVEVTPSFLSDDYTKVTDSSIEDDFIIIPDVVSLAPGQTQTVMVRYLGEPDLSSSKTYILDFNQVKVKNFSESSVGSKIKYLVHYEAVINILPQNARSQLLVSSVKHLSGKQWELTIDNVGNKYQWASDTEWLVSFDGQEEKLAGKDIVDNLSKNIFLPFSTTKAIFTDITSQGLNDKIEIKINEIK